MIVVYKIMYGLEKASRKNVFSLFYDSANIVSRWMDHW